MGEDAGRLRSSEDRAGQVAGQNATGVFASRPKPEFFGTKIYSKCNSFQG